MKTIPGSRRHQFIARISVFLIMATFIAGMVACGGVAGGESYTLTIVSTVGGSVTAPGEGTFTYSEGTVVNLVAKAENGYRFVNWTGNVSTIANINASSTTVTMSSNYTITANFEVISIVPYSLSISSTAGGSVTTPGVGTFTYNPGMVINLVATAASGYRFVNWTGSVGTIANITANSTTIAMNGNYSIMANFQELPKYDLTTFRTAGGSVTVPGEGTFTYDAGTVVSLVATPVSRYYFVKWTGNVVTIDNVNAPTTTITMNDNYSITANFAQIPPEQFALTISSTAGGSVTVPGERTFTYNKGTVVNLVATPHTGYRFVNWTGNVGTVANVNAVSTTITVNGDYSITANFMAQYDLTISSTAGGSVTTPGVGTHTYDKGTVVNLVANPTSGYRFVNWTGNVGTVANVNAASTTVTVNANYSITANFEAIPEYDLTIASTIGGSVTTPGEGTFPYDEGTVVNLVATPDTCYYFVNWTGDVGTIASVNAASTTVTMNGDYSITANFEAEEAVIFLDPNLEAAIRQAIGKSTGPICPSDLAGLTRLDAQSRNIVNLAGLEHCTSLRYLNLYNNQISDISPLSNLTSLEDYLDLMYNPISDISPLDNLTNLRLLFIVGTPVSDISPLSNLTNLTWLALNSNQISDISPLANLTNLGRLELQNNPISDISPLANLTNLNQLYLGGNQISDISPLANLTGLRLLALWNNQISDISPLANLTNLTLLNMHGNQISDISPLVQNAGLGTGDTVYVEVNPLSSDSINIYMPQLQARGVTVYY